MNINLAQTPVTEEWELVRDRHVVASAGEELLSLMREIVEAKTPAKWMSAIKKATELVEKLPILEPCQPSNQQP